jgi:hypothetical protein
LRPGAIGDRKLEHGEEPVLDDRRDVDAQLPPAALFPKFRKRRSRSFRGLTQT